MAARPVLRAPQWRCPSCRALSTTSRLAQVGPESPRYIAIPEPPQSSFHRDRFVKGSLPVPRNVFSKNARGRRPNDKLDETTRNPTHDRAAGPGSRQEWKHKLSEQRRRNLREGLSALEDRRVRTEKQLNRRGLERQREREEWLARPELEADRLTAPSVNMDVEALLHGRLIDPTREERMAARRSVYEERQGLKRAEREISTHSLFMQARTFCTTPEQLEQKVEEAFGTDANPIMFGTLSLPPLTRQSTYADYSKEVNSTGLKSRSGPMESRSAFRICLIAPTRPVPGVRWTLILATVPSTRTALRGLPRRLRVERWTGTLDGGMTTGEIGAWIGCVYMACTIQL